MMLKQKWTSFTYPFWIRLHYALGKTGWIGIILFILLAVYRTLVEPELHEQIKSLQKNIKTQPKKIFSKPVSLEPDLPWNVFPSTYKENALHALFYIEAAKAGVALPEVHYQQKPLSGTPLIEYRIELSTTTTYLSLKKWMAALMSIYPSLILEHLHLERDTVQSDTLKADIKWIWYATPEGCKQDCSQAHQWNFRNHLKITQEDAFRTLSYAPPAPPPAIVIPSKPIALPPPTPPKPVAPPLPFKYLGKLGEHHTVQKDEDFIELIPGQIIADHYKVDNVTEDQATFIYLPLQEKQHLLLRNE